MLILSISADTFPLSFSLSLSSSSFFLIFPSFPFSHLAKRKQPVLNTSAQVQGGGRADPIYQLVRLDTFNFHAPSILTLFQIFKTVLDRPGQWFLAKSRGVFAKLNFFSSFSLSLSLRLSSLFFFFRSSRLHGCLFRSAPGAELPRHGYTAPLGPLFFFFLILFCDFPSAVNVEQSKQTISGLLSRWNVTILWRKFRFFPRIENTSRERSFWNSVNSSYWSKSMTREWWFLILWQIFPRNVKDERWRLHLTFSSA